METQTNFDELIKYNVSEAVIQGLKDKYLHVKVTSFDDKENYEIAKRGHIEIKSLKAQIETRRKELKEDSLKFGRMVDSKAKQVVAPLIEIEDHLVAQRNVIDEEIKRRKEEAEKAEQKKVEERVTAFASCGAVLSFVDARNWTEETFKAQYEVLKINFETKQRIDAENELKRREYEEEMARKNQELEQREREVRRKEKEAFDIQVKENQRLQAEIKAKEEAEAKLRAEIEVQERERAYLLAKDARLEAISREFDTLEKCWAEIFRLTEVF